MVASYGVMTIKTVSDISRGPLGDEIILWYIAIGLDEWFLTFNEVESGELVKFHMAGPTAREV